MSYDLIGRMLRICMFYLEHLGRVPDLSGFDSALRSSDSIEVIETRIAQSMESRAIDAARDRVAALLSPYAERRKLLLLGAFGNGNLGDREMARVVAARLERDGTAVCFAFSELSFADYDFPEDRKLDHSLRPLQPRVLALFDALVIGGGGLLYYSHEPIWDPTWSRLIPIPYAILACGIGSPLAPCLDDLVATATVATSRDQPGLRELERLNPGARLCPDPVLAHVPVLPPRPVPDEPELARRLFVLRAPLREYHAAIRSRMRVGDAVAVFEAHMDHPVIYDFGDVRVVSTIDEFVRLVADFDLVVTDRYHAAILSLLCGCPAIGLCKEEHTSKQAELFRDLGLEAHCYPVTSLPSDFLPYDMTETRRRLERIQEDAEPVYEEVARDLFDGIDRHRQGLAACDPAGRGGAADYARTLFARTVEVEGLLTQERAAAELRGERLNALLEQAHQQIASDKSALAATASRATALSADLQAAETRSKELDALLATERAARLLQRPR